MKAFAVTFDWEYWSGCYCCCTTLYCELESRWCKIHPVVLSPNKDLALHMCMDLSLDIHPSWCSVKFTCHSQPYVFFSCLSCMAVAFPQVSLWKWNRRYAQCRLKLTGPEAHRAVLYFYCVAKMQRVFVGLLEIQIEAAKVKCTQRHKKRLK